MKKVLACIDGSIYGASVCDHAAWAASQLQTEVELLHVLDRAPDAVRSDLSGSIGLGTSEHLLEKLTQLDEDRARLRLERGRAILEEAEKRILAAGVTSVETRLRHGGLVDNVHELEADARVVVLGKRGEHADFARMHLGGSVEQVVRASQLPVLVASRSFKPINRVLIAFDGGVSSRKAVEFLLSDPRFAAFDVHFVLAGKGRVPDEHLAWLQQRLLGWLGSHTIRQIPGEAETVLSNYVTTEGVDLLAMGAYGHGPIRQFFVGSTTTAMLRACLIPFLLFR